MTTTDDFNRALRAVSDSGKRTPCYNREGRSLYAEGHSLAEVARLCGVSRRTAWRWCQEGLT